MKLVPYVASFLLMCNLSPVWAAPPLPARSLENFARAVFETFRQNDFATFHRHTVFALDEDRFKNFLLELRNDEIRDSLTQGQWSKWQQQTGIKIGALTKEINKTAAEAKAGKIVNSAARAAIMTLQAKITKLEMALNQKWQLVCLKQWRNVHRRLMGIGSESARHEAFDPILTGAEKEGIQWETARLTGVEVLHAVSFAQNRFKIDGVASPALHWESGLTYRLHFDKTTHGRAFRLSTLPEGPIPYERGIVRDNTGSNSLVARFETSPKTLYYFCPDQKGMGNRIWFTGKKHPRRNVLLSFSYGNPQRNYRLLLRDCFPIPPKDDGLRAGEPWGHWLLFERPVWLGPISKKASFE